jgi:hypothetical protein
MERCCGVMSSFHICQKARRIHENGHDARYKYVEMWGQDNNNQVERSYNLRTHMEKNENPTYAHNIDVEMESKNT